jgi:hypothetical protein
MKYMTSNKLMLFHIVMGSAMRYEEKVEGLKAGHKALADRLSSHSILELPGNVDKRKLERAYDKIASEYVLVLKKRSEID